MKVTFVVNVACRALQNLLLMLLREYLEVFTLIRQEEAHFDATLDIRINH